MENKKHIATIKFFNRTSVLCNNPYYYNIIDISDFEEMHKGFTHECFELYLNIINICKNCLRIYLKNQEKKTLKRHMRIKKLGETNVRNNKYNRRL